MGVFLVVVVFSTREVVVCKSLVYKVLCQKFPIRKCTICNVLCVKGFRGDGIFCDR